jgi:hypothetical protein
MDESRAVWTQLVDVRTATLRRLGGLSQRQLDARHASDAGEEAWSLSSNLYSKI